MSHHATYMNLCAAPPLPPYNAVAESPPFLSEPLRRPAYYYCNCKEGNGFPTELPDFRGVTGPVEGSLASDLHSAMWRGRVSRKGEKSSLTTAGRLGEVAGGRRFLKGGDFASD